MPINIVLKLVNNVFVRGWALLESLKVNQKGPTKRITEQIKELLMIIFYTSTANSRLKMNANEMHEELLKKVSEGEISKNDIPKISTIANWITKKTIALQLLNEVEK
ncbi:44590_t:CDS:2 [Gigaspora margarita]|uniref:44590_t:CDS:1 n=1 Tax=Gigaspora margarita TaxID=4874 RepID=A0ABN7USX7_GIGMA|nr:44590_t:CDS:2 [Gigaspora margarita]